MERGLIYSMLILSGLTKQFDGVHAVNNISFKSKESAAFIVSVYIVVRYVCKTSCIDVPNNVWMLSLNSPTPKPISTAAGNALSQNCFGAFDAMEFSLKKELTDSVV